MTEDTYTIVRFTWGQEKEVLREGVSLQEAQDHCNREDTSGDGWFDGFYKEENDD